MVMMTSLEISISPTEQQTHLIPRVFVWVRPAQLYIVNGSTQIAIQDPWIEDDVNWGDGGYQSTAFAAELNDNGTSIGTDDYYQLAVKQVNTWTDFWGGTGLQTDVNWQVYAIDAAGRGLTDSNGHSPSLVLRTFSMRI